MMDIRMLELWRNALEVSAKTGVPAPALVEAFLRAVDEAGPDGVSEEDAVRAGEQLTAAWGALAVLDDASLQAIADEHGMTVDELRRAYHAAHA